MLDQTAVYQEIEAFVSNWKDKQSSTRQGFLALYRLVTAMQGVELHFLSRPGISFSLRPKTTRQRANDFFAIIDIIDDNPDERWLSVCFYGDMITDPDGRGEVIPGGLAGEDGYCFDVGGDEPGIIDYLQERCREAYSNVA